MVIYHSFFRLDAFGIKLRSLEKKFIAFTCPMLLYVYILNYVPGQHKLLKYIEIETITALVLSLINSAIPYIK